MAKNQNQTAPLETETTPETATPATLEFEETAGHRGRGRSPLYAMLEASGKSPRPGHPVHFKYAGQRYTARENQAGEVQIVKVKS